MECEAVKKVRNDWGLTNVITMVPFCRTPEEGQKVLQTMAEFGLKQKENGLKVYVMCEIPSNVILADEFAKLFDGFSIGSNDLTQLILGVDRDSALVSHVYNERDKAVKEMISRVIKVAHKHNKKIGICGQAPSDYPEFAEFLVREGIDSISLNPDTVIPTRQRIAYVESTLGKTGSKTSKKHLGMVALIGIMAAGVVSLGAGCSDITGYNAALKSAADQMSPAQLREKILKDFEEEKKQELEKVKKDNEERMTVLNEDSFAKFSLQYPNSWQAKHWRNGLSAKDEQTGEYVSVFIQIVDHPVLDKDKAIITVGNRKAKKYQSEVGEDKRQVYIVEIELDKEILEINSNSDKFDKILENFKFADEEAALPDREINHWDIRDGKVCIQMITYARKNKADECQAYPTPCDVPPYWEVCDSGDVSL